MARDVQQIRAIFSWVVTQNVQEIEFPANVILDSHMDILRRMRDGQSSYTTLFTLLCRYVNVNTCLGELKSTPKHFEDDVRVQFMMRMSLTILFSF